MSEEFRVRDCACPDTPHDGDLVTFPPQLDLNAGLAVTSAIANATDEDELEVRLRRALFIWGPDGWNLTDDKGHPRPFDRKQLETEFTWNSGGFEIAEEANRRFGEAAIAPLAARLKRLSANGRTGVSSSPRAKKPGSPKRSASSLPARSAASTAPTP